METNKKENERKFSLKMNEMTIYNLIYNLI